ncbi:MAG: pyridoxal phosphate-dependent aminotransferase [Nitrososphaerota archaeon]|jgi:aspartate aminotransferase|nr:pyridoxal phosphate-dependent aminotransferase [Nitrososphaerota archaeon]
MNSIPIQDERVEAALYEAVAMECEKVGVEKRTGFKILSSLLAESKRVQGGTSPIPRETPMQSFAKAVKLQSEGKKIIRLDVGEPDFRPPASVVNACIDALRNFKTHYTLTRGIPELVEALRNYLKSKWGFDGTEDEIIITTGGRFAVYSGLASVLSEGESAIVIDPNWPAYKQAIEFIGARPLTVRSTLEERWNPPLEDIKNSIRADTRAIVISYPNNPTGKVLDRETFRSIIEIANDYGLTIISDETYVDYAFKSCPTILNSDAEDFICIGSFSKTWAMTGFRVGYAISSKNTIDKMLSMASLMLTSAPEFVQYAAIAALGCDREARENCITMKERSEAVCDLLEKTPNIEVYRPNGAIYLFPRIKNTRIVAGEFAERLLSEKLVSVTPGIAFGAYPEHFRISLCKPKEVLFEGVERIGEALL